MKLSTYIFFDSLLHLDTKIDYRLNVYNTSDCHILKGTVEVIKFCQRQWSVNITKTEIYRLYKQDEISKKIIILTMAV